MYTTFLQTYSTLGNEPEKEELIVRFSIFKIKEELIVRFVIIKIAHTI